MVKQVIVPRPLFELDKNLNQELNNERLSSIRNLAFSETPEERKLTYRTESFKAAIQGTVF